MEPLSCGCCRPGVPNGAKQTEPPDLSELKSIREERFENTTSNETATIRTKAHKIVLKSQEEEEEEVRENRFIKEAYRSHLEERNACCAALTMQSSKKRGESLAFQCIYNSKFSQDSSPRQTTKQLASNFYISDVFLVLKFLLFRLRIRSEQGTRWKNSRIRRRPIESSNISSGGGNHLILYFRLTLFLLLLVRVFSSQTTILVASGQLIQFNQDQESNGNNNKDSSYSQQERQETFYHHEDPQPLVYMHELGSGNGYPRAPSPSSSPPYQDYESSSSSVSPSLITAKCWNNNNDNDNDCKQINVITGPANGNEQQLVAGQSAEDDSIITPVVIFESSSTLEPSTIGGGGGGGISLGQSPAFLAPPYSSSTLRPDADNVVLARHRTPPTANDIYAAPPAGATILPPATIDYGVGSESSLLQPRPATTTTSPTPSRPPQSGLQGFRWKSGQLRPVNVIAPDSGTAPDEQQPVTRPTSTVFVATPRPKKPVKTTTMGRKCRDENDEDCDEPDEPTDRALDSDNQREGDDGGESSPMPQSKSSSSTSSLPDDDEDSDSYKNKQSLPIGSLPGGRGGSNNEDGDDEDDRDSEDGSGENPPDDNESGDSDGSEEDGPSGNSEPTLVSTTSHVEITPGKPLTSIQSHMNHNSAGGDSETKAPSKGGTNSSHQPSKPDAEIQILVHPTLPPTFPITTTAMLTPPDQGYQQTPDWSSTSTIMPDDTYTSKPVFPSTTERDENQPGESGSSSNSDSGSDMDKMNSQSTSAAETTTTQATDLATFTAIPMPPEMFGSSANRRPPFHRPIQVEPVDGSGGSAGRTTGNGENSINNNTVSEEHRFNLGDVTSAMPQAPKYFQAKPWREGKLGGSPNNRIPGSQFNNPGSSESWSSRGVTPSPNSVRPDSIVAVNQTPRMQGEMLPTLLLYASIVILIVTAIIFAIMALALWRRNTSRKRALLHSKLNGGPNQIIGSISHGSQLMANMARQQHPQQQPGLLSTYAPGKGLTMGKVTTSVIKASDENLLEEAGEDEDDGRILIDHQSNGGMMKDSAQLDGSSLLDGQMANGGGNGGASGHRHQQQRTSSWSTEEPTTSSGSQKTADSQQQHGNHQQVGQQQQPQHRPQYPNSLSDGRQNSSSISDQSQCSPVDGIQSQLQQPTVANYQHQQPNSPNPVMYEPSGQHQQQPPQAAQLYNQQAPVISDSVKRFNPSSRSVENLQQYQHNQGFSSNSGWPTYHVGNQQQQLLNQQQQQFYKPNGPPPGPMQQQQQPFIGPQPMNHHYLIQQQHQTDGYPIPMVNGGRINENNGNNNGLLPCLGPPPLTQQQQGGGLPDRLIFNGPPVSPARVAMNPLATLGRRYHPGMGLNRNIFSEDSSSFMTASPSLARTSSSSSFAFTTSQKQQTLQGSIRAKPLVDVAGRVFNDYTQTIHNANGAPPVLGRKDRSEAWYV